MKSQTRILIVILVVAGIASIFLLKKQEVVAPVVQQVETTQPPMFAWIFGKSDKLDLDGLPQSTVTLRTTYSGGIIKDTLIDTVQGSCNELPDADKDNVAHTATIQCYAAGAGERFRIIKGEQSYLVQKKEFEEGSPEYNPPEQEYKTVKEVPFSI